jgi:hypothetical protein
MTKPYIAVILTLEYDLPPSIIRLAYDYGETHDSSEDLELDLFIKSLTM